MLVMSNADRARSNWLKFQTERCVIAGKQNESSSTVKYEKVCLGRVWSFHYWTAFKTNRMAGVTDVQVTLLQGREMSL